MEKQQITYKGIPTRLSVDFLPETLQARREWKSYTHKYDIKSSNHERGEYKQNIGNAFEIKRPAT